MTGVAFAEWTNAPNSQMMDAFARAWSRELCEAVGLSLDKCAPIVPTGTILGKLRLSLATELGPSEHPGDRARLPRHGFGGGRHSLLASQSGLHQLWNMVFGGHCASGATGF